jgi:tetratricopeptide (TPR) repeat protein
VEIARSGGIADSLDIGMRPLATLGEDESLRVCFQCHAVKEELRPGHLTGGPLEEHFSLRLPLLTYRPYFPDGRIRLFAYQQTHLFSDCYLNGTLTCVDCHDPHSQGYRTVWGEALPGRFDDRQCTTCHASKAQRLEDHTHHPEASSGSRCVACHMPYLQEPDVGQRLRYARSDHTIPIPRPSLDTIFGVASACQGCHAWSLDHVQARMAEWYGELKPIDASVEGLIRAHGVKDRRRAAELMIGSRGAPSILLMQGLAYYFLTYLEPDMPALDPDVVTRLRELAAADDPDLQALALAALHLARGEDHAVRRFLAETLSSLAERGPAVRTRWGWALGWRGAAYMQRHETRRALATFVKALEVMPGDAGLLADIGEAYTRLGDYEDAIVAYRLSLRADSLQPLTLAHLGSALVQTGRADEAFDVYRRAVTMNPWEPEVLVSLGKVYVQRGSLEEALEAFQRAIALDPGLADAYFSLGIVQAERGEVERAIQAIRRGLRFQRNAEGARALLGRLEAGRR